MNLRNLAIWGVIVVVLIGLYSMVTGGGKAASSGEITYSQMLNKVDAGEIKSAEVRAGSVIITDQANKTFTAYTPNDQGDLVHELRSHGVNVSAKPVGGM